MNFGERFTKGWPSTLPCPYGPYRAIVSSIHDGDTLSVLVDTGFGLMTEVDIRVYGIQAPELHGADKAAGNAALAFIKTLISEGTSVRITTLLATTGEQQRTFTRFVAQVEFDGGKDLATLMVGSGHAYWCDRDLKPLPGPPPPIKHWVEVEGKS